MGTIKNGTKTLFFVTSPRTPNKMIPEIILLQDLLGGKPWNENKTNQKLFMEELCKSPFFESKEVPKNPDLSARDRINRAPKALGFVNLDPVVGITDAGERFVSEKRTEETILKQLLKFQLPSPYHRAPKSDVVFNVKPYLDLSLGTRFRSWKPDKGGMWWFGASVAYFGDENILPGLKFGYSF